MAHDMITVRRDDIENTLDWWSAGDLPDEDTIGRLHAAFKAQPTPEQRLAEGIICELVSEAEFGDIGDRLEDHAEGLAAIDFDQLRRNVADLISKATVTVTWPQDAERKTCACDLRAPGLGPDPACPTHAAPAGGDR